MWGIVWRAGLRWLGRLRGMDEAKLVKGVGEEGVPGRVKMEGRGDHVVGEDMKRGACALVMPGDGWRRCCRRVVDPG